MNTSKLKVCGTGSEDILGCGARGLGLWLPWNTGRGCAGFDCLARGKCRRRINVGHDPIGLQPGEILACRRKHHGAGPHMRPNSGTGRRQGPGWGLQVGSRAPPGIDLEGRLYVVHLVLQEAEHALVSTEVMRVGRPRRNPCRSRFRWLAVSGSKPGGGRS